MKAHTFWLRDRIATVAQFTGVYVALAPMDARPPFVVIHPQDGTDATDRLTGPLNLMNPRFTVHTVSHDFEATQDLAELIKAQLVGADGFGVVPDVPGEYAHRLWYHVPIAIQVDRDVSPPYVYHVAECGWVAQKEQ